MRIDEVEFADALHAGDVVPITALLEAGSVLRQAAAVRCDFDPDTNGLIQQQRWTTAYTNNQLGGATKRMGKSGLPLYPEALSIVANKNTAPTLTAILMSMREEVLFKRLLDGMEIPDTITFKMKDDVKAVETEVDSALTSILRDIPCDGGGYSGRRCPLILFDHRLLRNDKRVYGRQIAQDGNRMPDAHCIVDNRKCQMFAFPSLLGTNSSLKGGDSVGVDHHPENLHAYVIEPNSFSMIVSDAMLAPLPTEEPNEDLGIVTWITGFIFPQEEKIHRVSVRTR